MKSERFGYRKRFVAGLFANTVVAVHASRLIVHLLLVVVSGLALGVVVAKVPCHGELHTAAAMLEHLFAAERLRRREGPELAAVEQVAAVEAHLQFFVEEVLAHAQVHAVHGLGVALCRRLATAVVAAGLHGDVVGQLHLCDDACAPCEVVFALARHGLSVNVVAEAVDLVVVSVGVGRQVQEAEETVLERHLQACALVLGHVEIARIHLTVGGALPVDSLNDVGGGAVVGRYH